MNQFYKDLVDGNGSSSAQEWFDTFSNIAKTVELHDKNPLALASREMLQGTWISDDDPLSSITFSGRSEQKSYDGQDWLPDTFDLYSSLGPENQNKEGDEGTYLVIWTPEGTMEYAILEISDHKLSLQYLTRGNVLNFTRADD